MKRGRLELTPRGRVTLLLAHLTASAAWITADFAAQIATAVLAGPFLVDWLYKVLAPLQLDVRIARRRTRAGDAFFENVRLTNQSARSDAQALEVAEPLTSVRRGRAYVETLPRGASIEVQIPARARRRGIVPVRVFEIASRYPFGMVRRRVTISCAAELTAEPARTRLGDSLLERLHADDREPAEIGASTGNEYFALREYRHGDDARRVHARRSAALGAPVLRDLRGGDNPDAAIIVDLRRTPGHAYAFADPIEQRLSIAATLLDELLARHSQVECFVIDETLRSWQIDSDEQAHAFLDALAVARPVPFEPLGRNWTGSIEAEATAFWIPAGGFDARADRKQLPDVVLVREEEL